MISLMAKNSIKEEVEIWQAKLCNIDVKKSTVYQSQIIKTLTDNDLTNCANMLERGYQTMIDIMIAHASRVEVRGKQQVALFDWVKIVFILTAFLCRKFSNWNYILSYYWIKLLMFLMLPNSSRRKHHQKIHLSAKSRLDLIICPELDLVMSIIFTTPLAVRSTNGLRSGDSGPGGGVL